MIKGKNLIIITAAVLLASSCGGSRTAGSAEGDARYRRAPLREVSEEQLKAESRLIEAVSLQETGHVDEALAAFAALTHDEPQMAAAWFEQSQLLLQRRWTDSALHCALRAAELEPGNKWYLMAVAQTSEAAGDPEGAVAALERLEQMQGVSEALSVQKQKLWEKAGRPDRALRELQKLADAMPGEKRYQAALAQTYMQRKEYRRARTYYDRILAADPDDEYIHVQLAEYHKALGHTAQADSEMVRALANPRLETRTKLQLLTSFYTEEEFYGSRSKTCFRLMEMVARESEDASATAVFYGDVLMRQGRYDEAATQLALALQSDSSRYEVWEGLLICLTELPQREAELADYARRAESLFPMHTLPHHLTGLLALRHERPAEAVEALEKAVRWGFRKGYLEAETYGLLAEACYRSGQYERAWDMFDRYLRLRPEDWGTMNNYAYYLAERGEQLEKALQLSRKTIDAEPKNANSLDTYAWILHLLGRDGEALEYARRAVRLDPASETLRRHLETIENQQ